MQGSVFQQNSRSMLGLKSFTPDRVNVKKEFQPSQSTNNSMLSSSYSTSIFNSLNNSGNKKPLQVSSDRSIHINFDKLQEQSREIKKSIFSDPQKQLPTVNKKDIIDWVSGNSSIKFEDIMKKPVYSIKLDNQNNLTQSQQFIPQNNTDQSINNNYYSKNTQSQMNGENTKNNDSQDISGIQNDLPIQMTNSVIHRRVRKNMVKSLDQNSFLSNSLIIPQNKNQDQNIQKNSQQNMFSSQLYGQQQSNKCDFFSKYGQNQGRQEETEENFTKTSSKNTNSIDKVYDEFLQHSSDNNLLKMNKSNRDRNSSLGDLTVNNNDNDNSSLFKNEHRRLNKHAKAEKSYDMFESNSSNKITDADTDDLSNRGYSNTFDLNESKRTTSPNTTTSFSKNCLYKSILKNPKSKTQDIFGDILDISRSPKSKRVQFTN